MSEQHALLDYERFSEEEAVTVVRGDRPTPHFPIPRALLEFGEEARSGEVRVAPELSESHASERRLARLELAQALWGDRLPLPVDTSSAHVEPTSEQEQEQEFWDREPRYSSTSVRPSAQFSLPPAAAAPSGRRRVLSKFLFAALFSGVVTLLAYEALILSGFRW